MESHVNVCLIGDWVHISLLKHRIGVITFYCACISFYFICVLFFTRLLKFLFELLCHDNVQ